jgi:hypothetical protein
MNMKKYSFLCGILCFALCNGNAQNCLNYLLLQNNKKIEVTIYNKKGKEDGKQVWNVSNVKKTGNATTATVKSEFFDKKGKTINQAVNEVKCIGGALQMNLKMMLGEQQVKAWGENAQITAQGEFLEFPANIKEGDQLKDGNLKMDIKTEQGMNISMELEITNRKAIGKESITSPAGTWECMKLTSNQKIISRIAGIGIPIKMDVTEWYASGVGVIKTETKYGSTLVTLIQ